MVVRLEHHVVNANPIVGFDADGWTRLLTIEGEPAYKIGGKCDTCAFLFERVKSQRLSPAEVAERLQDATSPFDPALIATIDALVPSGEYALVDVAVRPSLVGPCDDADYFSHESVDLFGMPSYEGVPDNPRIRYWRVDGPEPPRSFGPATDRIGSPSPSDDPNWFFHFVVPMEPPHWLDRDRIDHYKAELSQRRTPAALGLSVLDVRAPANTPHDRQSDPTYVYGKHWCLATYLLDGHHKMQAAAEADVPLRMLAYLARDASMATREQIDAVLNLLVQDSN